MTGPPEDPAWYDLSGQVQRAIADLIVWVGKSGLKPVTRALGETVLSTPDLTADERVRGAWLSSVIVANALLTLFIVAAGFTVAAKDNLQARHGLKEILPRIGVAAVAVNVSLLVIGKAIWFANALTAAIAGRGVNGPAAEKAINEALDLAGDSTNFLLSLLVLSVVAMALIVVIVWVLRICLMITLIVLAPLAMLCHTLPQTEQLAFTWWRALTACLAIQLGQAVILIATLQVLLTPAGPTLLGVPSTSRGLLGVLIVLAMLWLLFKVPGWMRHFVLGQLGGGRGLVRQIIGLYFTAKTLGKILGLTSKAGPTAGTRTATPSRSVARVGSRSPTRRVARRRPAPVKTGSTRLRFSHAERPARPLREPVGSTRIEFSDPPGDSEPRRLRENTGPAVPRFSHASPSRPAANVEPTTPAAAPVFSHAPKRVTPRPAPTTPAGAPLFSSPAQQAARKPPSGGPSPLLFSHKPGGEPDKPA